MMAVEADGAAGHEVVEQHVVFRQRVVIRRNVAAVEDQLGVAIALGDVAQNLVVGAVLFDDEEDVLNSQRRQIRDAARGLELRAVGGLHFARAGVDLRRNGRRDLFQHPFILARIERALVIGRIANPFDVDQPDTALGIHRHRRREPGRGNRPQHGPLACAHHRQRIRTGAGNIERLAIGRERDSDRLAAQGAFGIGGNLHIGLAQAGGIDQGNGIGVAVGDRQRLLIRTQRQARGRQAHRDFAHLLSLAVHHADRARNGRAGHRIGHHLRAAAGRNRIARARPASAAIRNIQSPLGAQHDAKRRDADRDLPRDLACRSVDHCQRIITAEGDIGGGAVARERNASRHRMPLQLDVRAGAGQAQIGNPGDQNAVGPVARSLAGPQFAIAGPERHAGVGRRPGLDLGDLCSGRSIHQQHAARVEDGQHPFFRVEGDVHGPAGKQRLLAPWPQKLVRGNQEDTARLLPSGGIALEDGEDSRLLGRERRERQEGTDDRQLSHGS